MSNSAKIFKRQSGQMDAVVAEAKEILEATIEMVTRLKSEPPSALSLPPPAPASIPDSHRGGDTGRYSVHNPPASVHPAPASPVRPVVPRPAGTPRVQVPTLTPPKGVPVARRVGQAPPQAPRQEFRPLPPPLPRRAVSSSPDEE